MADAKTHWAFDFWLVFSSSGSVRTTKREPDVARDERKMLVRANLPKSLWSSPALRATITVTDDDHEPKFNLDLTATADGYRRRHARSARRRYRPAGHSAHTSSRGAADLTLDEWDPNTLDLDWPSYVCCLKGV